MISKDEVAKEILNLEKKDTSYAAIERLAWLYIVNDHLQTADEKASIERVAQMEGSEFLKACTGVPVDFLLSVLNEHMNNIMILYPKEYQSILRKLKNETV